MANLTVVIDDALLKRARIRALEQGTSINAVLRAYLETYAGHDTARQSIDHLLELSGASDSGSGQGGRTWRRDELHTR